MGYLVKISENDNDIIKMFYSKPDYGCYSCDTMYVSIKEYDEYFSKFDDNDDWVFLAGWRDTSESDKNSLGVIITDSFIIDSILQGKFLEYNSPLEFGLLK